MTDNKTRYTTKAGDRWDTIAYKAYGIPELAALIIMANPTVAITGELPGGIDLLIPIRVDPVTNQDLPPWLTPDEDVTDNPDATDPGIPVITNPVGELAFYPGFPRVVGSKIEFAIILNGSYPFSVQKLSGGVVYSSPLYLFSPGSIVSTPNLEEGGEYTVTVGSITSESFTVIGAGTPLAWVEVPYFNTNADGQPIVSYVINTTGTIVTKITRLSDNVIVLNQGVAYTKNQTYSTMLPIGEYRVEVGTLSAVVNTVITEITDLPLWLLQLGFSYDYQTLDLSMYARSPDNLEMSAEREDGNFTHGSSYQELSWGSKQYIPGTTDYLAYIVPFSEAFPFNPLVSGGGGFPNNINVVFKVRRVSDRNTVFKFTFLTPSFNVPFFGEIDLTPDPGDLPLCDVGPFISGAVTYVAASGNDLLQFLLNANAVYSFKWRVKNSLSAVVDSGVLSMVDGSLNPVFTPSNVPQIPLSADLDPGNYTLEIQGNSCRSAAGWTAGSPFTVLDDSEEPEPPIVTGPITPKLEQFSFKEHIDIQIGGSDGDWTINDMAVEIPGAGYENLYDINSTLRLRGGQLRNFKYEQNRTLCIVRYMIRIGEPDLSRLGQGATDLIQHFSSNATSAAAFISFNEHV